MDDSRAEVASAARAAHEAVAVYRGWAATQPMRQHRLVRKGKKLIKKRVFFEKQCQLFYE